MKVYHYVFGVVGVMGALLLTGCGAGGGTAASEPLVLQASNIHCGIPQGWTQNSSSSGTYDLTGPGDGSTYARIAVSEQLGVNDMFQGSSMNDGPTGHDSSSDNDVGTIMGASVAGYTTVTDDGAAFTRDVVVVDAHGQNVGLIFDLSVPQTLSHDAAGQALSDYRSLESSCTE